MAGKDLTRTQYDSIPAAWREQLSQAAENPVLQQRIAHREQELLPKFAMHYMTLRTLPDSKQRLLEPQYGGGLWLVWRCCWH